MNDVAIRRFAREISRSQRIEKGGKFRLRDNDPADTGPLDDEDKPRAREALEAGRAALAELQDRLYAQDRWSVLLVFQAMDAAGKDGVIKHVMSGVNPQGCQVYSFKAPSEEELDHDWMWRCARALPERGRIGIFNRSYYEEVLVVKVHPPILRAQKIPRALVGRKIWNERYQDIRAFERHMARNGTMILKFFLNVSRDEQKKRFLERIADPEAILRRFTRSNVQHPTYKALAELGKAAKTLFLCRYLHSEELRREVHEGLNVVETWNSANGFIFFGKGGEVASNRLDDQEVAVHALHLLQSCLVYVNTLMLQRVLAEPAWMARMTPADARGLTPLVWGHVSPYGTFDLDMEQRLDLELREAA